MADKMPVNKRKSITANQVKKTNQYAYIITPLIFLMADYSAVLCAEQLSFTFRTHRLLISAETFLGGSTVTHPSTPTHVSEPSHGQMSPLQVN